MAVGVSRSTWKTLLTMSVSFEWSSGAMLHAYMAFWVIGAPRIDKIEVSP